MSQVPERFANLTPLKRAVLALQEVQARLDAAERARNEPIAIIGIGCRIPGGVTNPDQFWQMLRDGISAVREVPADRWDVDALYDPNPDAAGKICAKRGGYLDEVDRFDASFFGIAPREAATMDPQQRLLLEVGWEALEHAGVAPDRLSGSRTGVFVGIAANDYAEILGQSDSARIDAYHASGTAHSVASGRLSYILGLQGPSISVDTACSSSLVAVHLAVQSLRAGECRMALAGGVNLILTPTNGIVFSKSHMLSGDGRCKTFDAAADGFGRAEGCGVIVLKRLPDALADGDRICAVIRGSAANQDGPSSGLTAPNGPAQVSVIRDALANGGVQPAQVGYVEAHGTGTPLGDPIEVQALAAALGEGRSGANPVLVGSLKTNVGHLEAAAGIGGLIKLVLSLQHGAIPAHLNLERLNPHVSWDELPLRIPTALTPWSRSAGPRIGGVSSFGFSGTNVHVVVEEAPAAASPRSATRPHHVLTVSARTQAALNSRVDAMAAVLRGLPAESSVADVVHTANAGRAQMPVRVAVQGQSPTALADALSEWRRTGSSPRVRYADVTGQPRVKPALLFTGQGAQYPGMGRALYESQPVFRAAVDRCNAIFAAVGGESLLDVIFGDRGDLLDQTSCTQPALFAVEYALAELWRSWGIEPAALLGHSIGEYVAAAVAGVFSVEDAMTLVTERGRLMQSLPRDGMMAAVFADESRVAGHLARHAADVSVAAVNGPNAVVISGRTAAVQSVVAALAAEGIRGRTLNVSHAFHSPLMDPILDQFEAAAARVRFNAPRIKIISNLTGKAATAAELCSPRYWRDHLRGTVRFADGIKVLASAGTSVFVEAGPQPTLIGMAMACVPGADITWVPSLRQGQDDWQSMLGAVAALYARGADINWAGVSAGQDVRPTTLPTYPFERERFWVERSPQTSAASPDTGDHPLVGRRITSPAFAGIILEGRLSPQTHAYLYDHRVHGTPILPATGFLEIALAAARANGVACSVSDFSIREALVLPESGAVTVQVITAVDRETTSFRIYSGSGEPGAAWSLHAEGKFGAAHGDAERTTPNVDALRRPEARLADGAFYDNLESRGLNFGPAFRGVQQLWIGDRAAVGVAELPASVSSDSRFVVHPVLLDAALQIMAGAVFEGKGAETSSSYLPVHLQSFELHEAPARRVTAHASVTPRGSDLLLADITLLDADDDTRVLARLSGLTLKRAEGAALRRTRVTDDWLYEVRWERAGRGPLFESQVAVDPRDLVPSIEARVRDTADAPGFQEYERFLPLLDDISAGFIADALRTLRLPMEPGSRFTIDMCVESGALESFRPLLARFVEILVERGVVRVDGDACIVTRATGEADAQRTIERLLLDDAPCGAELDLLLRCGPHLGDVLKGNVSPLALLFPDGSGAAAERLYQDSPAAKFYNGLVQSALAAAIERIPADRPLRILEIGGGTASTTGFALQVLPLDRIEYTFSDISPLFVARAEHKFGGVTTFRGRPLDIERDPLDQGFAAHGYDLVIAANVLHATTDLAVTFDHVKRLLAPGGLMVLLEMTRRLAWIDVTFGLTDGWWRFTDRELRRDYPLLDRRQWSQFLSDQGFTGAVSVPASDDENGRMSMESVVMAAAPLECTTAPKGRWLLMPDAGGVAVALCEAWRIRGRDCRVMANAAGMRREIEAASSSDTVAGVVYLQALDDTVDDVDPVTRQQALTGGLLDLVRTLGSAPASPRLFVVTRGAQQIASTDMVDAHAAALWGMSRSIAREHPEWRPVRIDLDPLADVDRQVASLLGELALPDGEDEVAYRGPIRHVSRLVRFTRELSLPTAVTQLKSGTRGVLESLEYVPCDEPKPGIGEVAISVRAAALNFRDVVNALGIRHDSDRFGSECAGTIVAVGAGVEEFAVGDEVMAIAPGSLATRTIANAHLVVKKPADLPFEDAAGIPIVFVTADYALNAVGRVGRGDCVLVHAAAGGVGLAALQLARRAGADVIATAGTAAKRAFLHSLGVAHVFDSRSLSFAGEVMRVTAGKGVSVVLNSLAGDFIPASLGVLAAGGRFLEIGKNNIWTSDDVRAVRPDVTYHAIDLTADMEQAPDTIAPALRALVADVARGSLRRLPRRVFGPDRAADAFRFMAKGHHIGKVIVSQQAAEGSALPGVAGTCLITGGLSGLGLATASRLVERGCRSLMLMARSAPSDTALLAIEAMRAAGAEVVVHTGDVSKGADVESALRAIDDRMAPLSGIIHSAGVLDDGVLVQQEWSRFAGVFAPKIGGASHLHRLTEHRPLDFFVLFSSVAALVGPRGQANHAAANAFLDALAHRRRASGLPALSVNWGAWSEIGAAVRHGVHQRISADGIGAIDPAAGLDVLEELMRGRATQAAVLPADWSRFGADGSTWVPRLFASVITPVDPPVSNATAAPAVEDFAATVRQTPAARRQKFVSAHVRQLASRVLGGGRAAHVDGRVALNEVGLDSLMAVELRNVLGASIGRALPATLLFDYPTIDALTGFLLDSIVEPDAAPAAEEEPEAKGAASVLDQIDELSDDEIDRLLAARMAGTIQSA